VDKTKHIYNFVTENNAVFLSRPRRFGKSLLVSTLNELFKGNKQLFEGLWIYDKWDWTQQYPVIRIDWTLISHKTPDVLEISLREYFQGIARRYGITLLSTLASDRFSELIQSLYDTTGKKAVVLIDEYDKPVTSHLFTPHLKDIKIAVHDLYQVMKGNDDCLKFIFLTGVSKFSGLSVFSALNNIQDITMDPQYAAICGYTQDELETYFSEHIANVAEYRKIAKDELLESIKYWYDGYSWDGVTRLYNPYSTLTFFGKKQFDDYWYETGTPAFLLDIVKRKQKTENLFEPVIASSNLFLGFDTENLDEEPLLFQTGYLTVKNIETNIYSKRYILGIPNTEVKNALLKQLLNLYSTCPIERADILRNDMQQQIYELNAAGLRDSFRELLFSVPYQLEKGTEASWHAIFLTGMKLLGFNKIDAEKSVAGGRIDILLKQPDGSIVIAEIKYHAKKRIESLLDDALKQIHEKQYYQPYANRNVTLLGIAFTGNDVDCKFEKLKITDKQ
jgi:hypothetical protein